MGKTMAEKILTRASGRDAIAGEFVTASIDALMAHDLSFWSCCEAAVESGHKKVWNQDRIVAIMDHAVPPPNVASAEMHRKSRKYAQALGIKAFYDVGVGISHQVFVEKGYALPGSLIVGGDSHATTYGAFGAASTGIGSSEVTYVMAKGTLWFMVPESIRFVLTGILPRGTSSKDIILRIAGQYTAEVAQYRAVEFTGPAAKALSIGERMTITNMGVEIGAKFAFFEADEKTIEYLRERTDRPVKPFGADPDARYMATYEMDISSLEPLVACPHSVDNVKSVMEIGNIPVHQAFIGSCTNGRLEDLERAAAILKGRKVNPGTRLLVIPASHEIYLQSARSGVLQTFLEAGAMLGTPTCGPCGGRHMGILAEGETAVSSTNRNFKGRMGHPESFVYLASPETVAASAIEGKIADPRKYLRN